MHGVNHFKSEDDRVQEEKVPYFCFVVTVKGKAIPVQAQMGPQGSRRLWLPGFLDSRHMKVVRLSALYTGRLYPQGRSVILISVRG